MPPATPPAGAPEPKPSRRSVPWDEIRQRANTAANISALFLFLIVIGVAGGYFFAQTRKSPASPKSPTVQTLSPSELERLAEIGANLGTAGQTLNIGANALFRGKAEVTSDLTIGGRLNANGPVTLSQLNITGSTAATGLNVGSNLQVGGTTTMQRSLTVNDLTTINSGLNVSGQISAGSLTVKAITVQNLTLSGPLTIAHLSTTGPTPFFGAGAVGAGGTVSISGNDTAGTININTGSGPTAGTTLMTVTFRAAYNATPHVLLTPRTSAAATADAYVIPTTTNFRILAASPAGGQTLTYDYFVTQ